MSTSAVNCPKCERQQNVLIGILSGLLIVSIIVIIIAGMWCRNRACICNRSVVVMDYWERKTRARASRVRFMDAKLACNNWIIRHANEFGREEDENKVGADVVIYLEATLEKDICAA
jgi:hypothetical protein